LHPGKCVFAQPQVQYLAFIVWKWNFSLPQESEVCKAIPNI
jgi:hypothetical protein